jgi:hypothetical protein
MNYTNRLNPLESCFLKSAQYVVSLITIALKKRDRRLDNTGQQLQAEPFEEFFLPQSPYGEQLILRVPSANDGDG